MLNKKQFATMIGCLGLVMWAFAALLTASIKNLPIFEILAIVFTISFTITAAKLSYCREWHKLKQPVLLWIVGILGVYGNDVLYIAAFQHAPSVQADLINYLWPILVILFAGCLPREKFTFKHMIAALLGLSGAYILITNGHGLAGFKTQYLKGYLLALMDAIVWSLYTLVARHYHQKPVEMMGLYCGAGAVISLLLHAHLETTIMPSLNQIIILCIMGLTTQGFAYFFWDYGVKNGNFKLLSILSYGNPVLSVALLICFGMSKESESLLIACLLVSSGGIVGGINWKATLHFIVNTLKQALYSWRSSLTSIALAK